MNQLKALDKLRAFVESESGIKLGPEKVDLLINRIRKRLRALRLSDEGEYVRALERDHTGAELVELINVVSTNHTFFYREPQHFDLLAGILQHAAAQARRKLRLWCAASSSGEEPYMLSIVVHENFDLKRSDVKILATDISTTMLNRAQAGVYDAKQLEKLPQHLVKKYFSEVTVQDERRYLAADSLKSLITFKKLNLSKFPYPLSGPLDVIFCRNVMIYFDLPLRARIIHECERLLAPGGSLFLSLSENTLGIDHSLEPLGVGVYQKSGRR